MGKTHVAQARTYLKGAAGGLASFVVYIDHQALYIRGRYALIWHAWITIVAERQDQGPS